MAVRAAAERMMMKEEKSKMFVEEQRRSGEQDQVMNYLEGWRRDGGGMEEGWRKDGAEADEELFHIVPFR